MRCDSVRDMLGAFLDGELDASAEFQVRAHLAECSGCSVAYRGLTSLKDGIRQASLYHAAPAELEARIQTSLRQAKTNEGTAARGRWLAIAASVLLAVLLGWSVYVHRRAANAELLAQEILSAHVRSMIGTHLVDVPSSDQHTVKPWFAGKLDYSPPVKDLKSEGFALVGGRIEYLSNRRVAALVYQRRKHVIDVFIWPTGNTQAMKTQMLSGYNVVRWTTVGMAFWAISDLNAEELQQFAALLAS